MKKITIMDIAKAAGVSKATVSMVMNKRDMSISEDTRNKILGIAEEMNYIPNSIARSLATKKSGTIGIVLPDITNPFFSEFARAIEDSADAMGYNVIFCNTDNDILKEEKYIKLLIGKLVEGVILIAGGESKESLHILKNNNVPFVLVDRYLKNAENLYGVYCMNKLGVSMGVRYLYEKNKRKIAFVKGPDKVKISAQRLEGYVQTMREYGIFDEKLIFEGNLTVESGITSTEQILGYSYGIDAVIYSNDLMAFGGIKVFTRAGFKIPEDICIMGFDNIKMCELAEPELTTISQPIYEMGKKSCRILVDVINNQIIDQKQIFFEPELVIRGTA